MHIRGERRLCQNCRDRLQGVLLQRMIASYEVEKDMREERRDEAVDSCQEVSRRPRKEQGGKTVIVGGDSSQKALLLKVVAWLELAGNLLD